jgi:hypothetical protein
LGFADLLGVTEWLVAVLQGFAPGAFELVSGRFAFNDQERFSCVVADQNVGSATAGAMAQLPGGFEFDVLWLVAFFEQAMDAFENDEILVGG